MGLFGLSARWILSLSAVLSSIFHAWAFWRGLSTCPKSWKSWIFWKHWVSTLGLTFILVFQKRRSFGSRIKGFWLWAQFYAGFFEPEAAKQLPEPDRNHYFCYFLFFGPAWPFLKETLTKSSADKWADASTGPRPRGTPPNRVIGL